MTQTTHTQPQRSAPLQSGAADLASVVAALQQLVNEAASGRDQQAPQQVQVAESVASEAYIMLRRQVEAQVAHTPTPVQTLGEYASQSPELTAELHDDAAELRETVARVRARFISMADHEIRRIINESLGGVAVTNVAPPHAPDEEAPTARGFANAQPIAEPPPRVEREPDAISAPQATVSEPAVLESPPKTDALDSGVYEGTVTLQVIADGSMHQVVSFVDELCQHPEFRMLRMTGNPRQDGAEISLGLREPLPFARVLMGMETVSSVSCPVPTDPSSVGQAVTVWLEPSPAAE